MQLQQAPLRLPLLQRQQIEVRLLAIQAGDQLSLLEAFVDVVETQLRGTVGDVQAHVIDQLQRSGRQVHIGARPLHQRLVAAAHRARGARERGEPKVLAVEVVQSRIVGGRQPGIGEAPGEPAGRRLQQAFLGDLLHGSQQRQIHLVCRYVAGNQLEDHVAAVLAPLPHQHPERLALPAQRQAHRHAEVGQFAGEMQRIGNFDRAPALQHFAEIERPADALVAQPFGAGFDEQWQRLEGGGVLADQGLRHRRLPRRGRPQGGVSSCFEPAPRRRCGRCVPGARD